MLHVLAPRPLRVNDTYRNTLPVTEEAPMPGDLFMERRIRSLVHAGMR